ncbi:MAG: peptide deformylase [Pseudomonadota bacterium]
MSNPSNFLENYQFSGDKFNILVYPNPILKKKSRPVTVFDDNFRTSCKNMLYTMYEAPGVGLAAPQVGIGQRFFVLDVDYKREKIIRPNGTDGFILSEFQPQVFVNPIIRDKMGEIIHEEGCLSVPGFYEEIKRAENIIVEFCDLWGNPQTLEASGLLAVCIQHENDHLDGIIFLERLGPIKKKMLIKKYLKEQDKKLNDDV